MAVLAVGGEADCYEPFSGSAFAEETTAGRFDANASRTSMKVRSGVSDVELFLSANVTEAWIHAYIYQESVSAQDYIIIQTIAGVNAFKIALESDGRWSLYKWSGAAWGSALATSASPVLVNAAGHIDIHIKLNATGSFSVTKDAVSVVSFTGDTTGDSANFGRIHFRGGAGASENMDLSQVIVADEDTTNWVLQTQDVSADGTTMQWETGDHTTVDESGYNNADFISTPTVGNVDTFATNNINAAWTNYTVKAVVVAMRGSIDPASPVTHVQAAVRVGGTNYFSSNLALANDGSEHSAQNVFSTNPNTSGAWSQTTANSAEGGVKAV